jgi:hypothetical protein
MDPRAAWAQRLEEGRERVAGAKLLVNDVSVAALVLDDFRARAVERVFGVPRHRQFLVTLIAAGVAERAMRNSAQQVGAKMKGPSRTDALIGFALLRESVYEIAGATPEQLPVGSGLIALAVIGGYATPVVRKAAHNVRTSVHKARAAFGHRYGHVVSLARRAVERESTDVEPAAPSAVGGRADRE